MNTSANTSSSTAAIGLFGGTFDPLHAGHMHIATTALETLPIAKLRWIPSGDPGHRNAPLAKGTQRLAMVRVAIAGEPRFELDAAEVMSGEPTFTVPTLRRLRATLGDAVPLVLVSGADSFLSLPSWHAWRELFDLAHIAVAARPGYSLDVQSMHSLLRPEYEARRVEPSALAATPCGRIAMFPLSPLDVSATDLRARLARGERPTELLPPEVLAYIDSHRLYRPV